MLRLLIVLVPLLTVSPRMFAQPAPIEELTTLRPVLDSTGFDGMVLVYDLKKDRWSAVRSENADQRRILAST
jgi:hypothetical protein